jgi:hypothetical protein
MNVFYHEQSQDADDVQVGFCFTQEQHTSIAGDVATFEIQSNFLPITEAMDDAESYENNVCCVLFDVTKLYRRSCINIASY